MSGRLVQAVNVALALGCLGLTALVYTMLAPSPAGDSSGTALEGQPARITSGNAVAGGDTLPSGVPAGGLGLPPLSSFREISRRPLFSETRRPAAPAQSQAAPALDFVVTGIVTTDSGAVAFLRLKGQPTVVRTTVGQNVQGWRVDRILPDRIVVRQGDSLEELMLGKLPGNSE